IEGAEKLRASDIEFSLSQPSYTIDTLIHLAEKYPTRDFSLIMGEDNLSGFHKWKNADILLRDYHIIVYPRPGYDGGKLKTHPSDTPTETPVRELSSPFVRLAVRAGRSTQFYVPDQVIKFIDK